MKTQKGDSADKEKDQGTNGIKPNDIIVVSFKISLLVGVLVEYNDQRSCRVDDLSFRIVHKIASGIVASIAMHPFSDLKTGFTTSNILV